MAPLKRTVEIISYTRNVHSPPMDTGGPISFGGQGPPPQYPQRSTTGGKPGGTNVAVIVVIVVVIVAMLVLGAIFFLFSFLGGIDGEPWEERVVYETEAHIEDGGHFRYTIAQSWEEEVEVNISVTLLNGTRFDVYIMDEDQYRNAYGNESTGSFASTFSWQNVSVVSDMVVLRDTRSTFYLIVDNVDMPQVPGSTTPEGPISVDIQLVLVYRYGTDW